MRKLSGHESFDSARNLIGVLSLRKSGSNNLIDDLLSVLVLWWENLSPKCLVLSLDQISCLHSVEEVSVCDFDEFVITLSPCSLVSCEGKIWISLLAVLSYNFGVVILIVYEEALWVLVDVDANLGQSVMKRWLLDSLVISLL
jgi:hypothetical protein